MTFDLFFDQPKFDYKKNKEEFINNMNFLKQQSVEESVFYKKWQEVQNYSKFISKSLQVKAKIWKPSDITNKNQTIDEIEKLKPNIKFIQSDDESLLLDWLLLRVFCHSMPFEQTPGRFLRFIVYDEETEKYLGATSVSSDVISITDRDNYIGWSHSNRIEDRRIAHSAIGSCIMATQPFGYNFIGGKLVACLTTSSVVQNVWQNMYNCKLVGLTTTSLYGTKSMYNNIPYWHKCGASKGKISIKPDEKYYEIWHNWIKENKSNEYEKKMQQKEGISGPVTGAKLRVLQMIFSELKIQSSKYTHGYERGVYYSGIYENFKDFFQNKISEEQLIMKPKFEKDINGMVEWWRPKAINRYIKLHAENNLKPEILYYNTMIQKDYEDCKNKFFADVGR